MKKVVDWTFGSIFRTFGRIIAYLIFGLAISYILHSLDFRITDLFLDNVRASEYQAVVVDWKNSSGTSLPNYYGQWQQFNYFQSYIDHKYNTNATIPKGTKGVIISINFRDLYTASTFTCNYVNTNNPNICWEYRDSNSNNISFKAFYNNYNNASNCYFLGTNSNLITNTFNQLYLMIYCPIPSNIANRNFGGISYTGSIDADPDTQQTNYKIGIDKTIMWDIDGESAIIDNQNQNTQSIIQNQQNSTQQMLDSNTTQAESDAEGFFGDFDVPDVGGLSAIITAPLNTIRSLLSSSCSELVLPLPYVDEDLRLPCMNSIYTQHFGLFFSLYQTIILAIIAYRCIRSIYFDITGFTNPDDDRIEVMDL